MAELVPGGNLPLPDGALTVRVPGPFDVSALITDDGGKVGGDADFVFYNQPVRSRRPTRRRHPHRRPAQLRAGADRVTVVVSPADPGTPLGRLPAPVLSVTGAGGARSPGSPRRAHGTRPCCCSRRSTGAAPGGSCERSARGTRTGWPVSRGTSGWTSWTTAPRHHPDRRPSPAPSAHRRRRATGSSGWSTPPGRGRFTARRPRRPSHPRRRRPRRGHGRRRAPRCGEPGRRLSSTGSRPPGTRTSPSASTSSPARAPRPSSWSTACGDERRGPFRATRPSPTWASAAATGARATCTGRRCGRGPSPRRACAAGGRGRRPHQPRARRGRAAAAGRRPPADHRRAGAQRRHGGPRLLLAHLAGGHPALGPGRRRGLDPPRIGENIACGQRSPAEVVDGWMNSPGHRANILKPDFTHIGDRLRGRRPGGHVLDPVVRREPIAAGRAVRWWCRCGTPGRAAWRRRTPRPRRRGSRTTAGSGPRPR